MIAPQVNHIYLARCQRLKGARMISGFLIVLKHQQANRTENHAEHSCSSNSTTEPQNHRTTQPTYLTSPSHTFSLLQSRPFLITTISFIRRCPRTDELLSRLLSSPLVSSSFRHSSVLMIVCIFGHSKKQQSPFSHPRKV